MIPVDAKNMPGDINIKRKVYSPTDPPNLLTTHRQKYTIVVIIIIRWTNNKNNKMNNNNKIIQSFSWNNTKSEKTNVTLRESAEQSQEYPDPIKYGYLDGQRKRVN